MSNLNAVEISLGTFHALLYLYSPCPGVFIFSHNVISFHVPFSHFHSFPYDPFFSLEKASILLYGPHLPSLLMHQTLHFQIDASQLPGAGWRWYEQMKVGFTVLTEISNSSISALRQSKKPTAACLEAASRRKKKTHIRMFVCMNA